MYYTMPIALMCILKAHTYNAVECRHIKSASSARKQRIGLTRSEAAGFGRHGMPPPASNDTGTSFCFPN